MSSSLSDHKVDEEALIDLAINERLLTDQLENKKTIDEIKMADTTIPAQANIKNRKTDVISLIDISHNKKWICYISHLRNQSVAQGDSPYVLDEDNKKITYITRHRLIEEDKEQENLSGELKNNGQHSTAISMPDVQQQQISTNITQYTSNNSTHSYCRFLSISPDGQYAALSSFYESESPIPAITNYCDIFKVDDHNNFQFCFTWQRAMIPVFLDTGSDSLLCLALICEVFIAIFNNFQDKINDKVGYCYDVQSFFRKSNVSECIAFDTPFIEEVATWASIENAKDKTDAYSSQALKAITLSRHIKDNIIVTPYVGGTVRAWSIKDNGIRLTSFFAPDEHIVAFSIDCRLVAALTDGIRGAKIYDVKSGMLMYTLHSTYCSSFDENTCFYVSHATFCYDSRYLALSLVLKTTDNATNLISTKVVFEVWYIEAEKLIYSKTERTGVNYALGDPPPKTLQPFVTEITTKDKDRYLKGVFSCFNEDDESEIKYVELDIDSDNMMNNRELQDNSGVMNTDLRYSRKENGAEVTNNSYDASSAKAEDSSRTSNQHVKIEWIESNTNIPDSKYYEISNELDDYNGIRCGHIYIGDKKKFLVRFGRHMIQLWRLGDSSKGIKEDDELVYIRAYNCPYQYYRSLALLASFEVPWEIDSYKSIKFVGRISEGRLIVNIKAAERYYRCCEDYSRARYSMNVTTGSFLRGIYYTEEIFLPALSKSKNGTEEDIKINHHILESAFQALCYLHNSSALYEVNLREENNIKKSVNVEKPQYKEYVQRYGVATKDVFYKNCDKNLPQLKKNLQLLFNKTLAIINNAIDQIEDNNCLNFFSTMAGSRVLALVASFDIGREIIKKILKNEAIPIGIFGTTSLEIKKTGFLKKRKKAAPVGEEHPILDGIKKRKKKRTKSYRKSLEPPIKKASRKGERFSTQVDENILKILLENLCFDLFELLFNRILSDSNKIGPGCLPALTDSLIHLQQENHAVYSGLLSRCLQKLLYLEVQENVSGILSSDLAYLKNLTLHEETSVSDVRYWATCCMTEQLSKSQSMSFSYKDKLQAYILFLEDSEKYFGVDRIIEEVFLMGYFDWKKYVALWILFKRSLLVERKYTNVVERCRICVIPFSYINTYDILPFEYLPQFYDTEIDSNHLTKPDQLYKKNSWFTFLASDNSKDNIFRQGDTVLEIMLQYKWKTFIRKRFIGVCLIHVVYYVSYCTGVLFAKEMYGYDSANEGRSLAADSKHIVSLVIMFLSGFTLFFQEVRQIYYSHNKMNYFRSWFNYVDLLAFILPLVTFFQMVFNGNYFYEICSISTLVLWMHGVLRLRAISFIGVALETIIQLIEKVASILSVWLIVVLAFTHSFIVLLRQQPNDYFQENYNGTISVPNGENAENVGNTNTHDTSSSNGFTDPFKAFYQVWLIIFGVWDPVINGNAGDDRMLFVLCILFALITVLIFTNMVIALMSSTVDEVKKRGKSVWVSHFAAVIVEIEQLWCSSSTKRDRKNNPSYIYYAASVKEVEKHKEMLKSDTERLRRKVFELDD